jgi:hypothetical protein
MSYLDHLAQQLALQMGLPKRPPLSRRQALARSRRKPPTPTVIKRSTANNLNYLESRNLIAKPKSSNLVVALSSLRKLSDGTLRRDSSPTNAA